MSDRDGKDSGTRVYVGGLNDGVKKEDLESEFEKFGKLNNVWVAFNPPGFAFIEFSSHDDAENACDNLNGTDFLGSKLRVEIARGKNRLGSDRRRGFGGGFRGSRGRGGGGFRSYDRSGYRGRGSGRGSSRGRYNDYDRRDDRYRRDYGRSSGSDSYRRGSRDSYRGRGSGGSGRYESNGRFRSRSPARR